MEGHSLVSRISPMRPWAVSEISGAHFFAWVTSSSEAVPRVVAGGANEQDDETLIAACLTNDRDSFAKLIERYEHAVARILWRFTRDPLVLEELVQDTFVEAYFSLHRFRKGAPFFPWLRVIATRVGYRSWRRAKRDLEKETLLAQMAVPFANGASSNPSETADYVYHMLAQLPAKERLILTLQYLEGFSTQEIAEQMGWSVTLAKVRAFRARKHLRAFLSKMERT